MGITSSTELKNSYKNDLQEIFRDSEYKVCVNILREEDDLEYVKYIFEDIDFQIKKVDLVDLIKSTDYNDIRLYLSRML